MRKKYLSGRFEGFVFNVFQRVLGSLTQNVGKSFPVG
jgi:hypothetical protein